jgi:DUF2075 family protein
VNKEVAIVNELANSSFILPDDAQMTGQQRQLEDELFAFIDAHQDDAECAVFLLRGDAGSGKSAVLAQVFTHLQARGRGDNHLLVNHNEMLKVYKEVAADSPALRKKDFEKPTPFINRMQKAGTRADVVFVDEAHLLLSRSDPYNRYRGSNQIQDLLQLTHVLVLVVDFNQVVKLKSHWNETRLRATLAGHPVQEFRLTQQLRMQNAAVSAWINDLIAGKLRPLPQPQDYELRLFNDGQPLYDWVQVRDRQYGLARLIATSDFPFRVFDDKQWFVDAGSLHLPWDKINFTDRPWAGRPETLHEVGSIYTIQGFDLNYAGVILGPSIDYDPQADRVVTVPARFEDQEAMRKRGDLANPDAAVRALIMHTVNILLKRGRMGLGIYAVNPRLRQRLAELNR